MRLTFFRSYNTTKLQHNNTNNYGFLSKYRQLIQATFSIKNIQLFNFFHLEGYTEI